jgi:hypothetical protein
MNRKPLVLIGLGIVLLVGVVCGGFFGLRWLFPPEPPSIDHRQALTLLGELRAQHAHAHGHAPSKVEDLKDLDGYQYVLPLIQNGEIEVFWNVQPGVSGLAGTILAWEKTANAQGARWALFLDGHVAQVTEGAIPRKQNATVEEPID